MTAPWFESELFFRLINSSYTSVESSWNCWRVSRVSFCRAVERELAGSEGIDVSEDEWKQRGHTTFGEI